jgi:outer membrane protein TolC
MNLRLVLIIGILLGINAKASNQSLSLKQALQLAYKQNIDFVQQTYDFESAEITYRNAWKSFFLPTLSLTFTSDSSLTLGSFPGTPASETLPAGRTTGYPGTSAKLALSDYTIFNNFKDRITFDMAKLNFTRAKQRLMEAKRKTTFGIVTRYYDARLIQEKLMAAEKSLQIAKSIVRLVRSRVAIGQATATELSSIEVDTNSASIKVTELKGEFEKKILDLNIALNQPASERLILTTPLNYSPTRLTFDQAFAWFKENAPGMRDQKVGMEGARTGLELAEKNLMPLPEIKIGGVGVTYGNRYSGGYGTTDPGKIELTASASLTIPLYGPGGLFNKDTLRTSQIALDKAELSFQQFMISNELDIRGRLIQLQQLEEKLKTQKESMISSANLLEKTMADAASQKTNRLELRDALDKARSVEFEYLAAIYEYVQTKTGFYELIGKDLEPE